MELIHDYLKYNDIEDVANPIVELIIHELVFQFIISHTKTHVAWEY